ncbi:unnamed protein product [Effrenium voratum]|uniref:Uncharacterized protein n=1 Tax=Effrenium voratum TaxID=2562239 RepID=A0AA36J7G4_9DINO|nr:unnamed protein product [Effrenium voratum]
MFDLTRITIPPSLGERCFVLRSRLNIRETAVRMGDVQYYTLPSIAQLQLPAIKGSWESIYRSLLPFRDAIINDGHRIRSISELAAFLKVSPDNGPMTRSAASPSIFDLCLVIYDLSCPCNLDFLKVVGLMYC